jgi:hypothetical protein
MLRRLGLLTGIARQLQQDASVFGCKVSVR